MIRKETIAKLSAEIEMVGEIKETAKKECEQLTTEAWTGASSAFFAVNHNKWAERIDRYITKMTFLKETLEGVLEQAKEANSTALSFAGIMGGSVYEGSQNRLSIDWDQKEKLSLACGRIREHYEEYAKAITQAQGEENTLCYTSFYMEKAQPAHCKIRENQDWLVQFQAGLDRYEDQIIALESYLINQLNAGINRLDGDLWMGLNDPWVQRTETAMTALRQKGYSEDECRLLHERGFKDDTLY